MGDNFTPEIAAAAPSGEADDEEAEDGEEEADEGPPLHGAAADGGSPSSCMIQNWPAGQF